jgi:cysteine desulfurase family protein
MTDPSLTYLDFAATSAVRPPAVIDAMRDYMADIGATPGRGGHRLAIEAGRVALRCRQAIADLLGLPGDPGRIAFTFNATHALNTALLGILEPGDAVVVTAFDHNAVLRTVHRLAVERGVDVRLVSGTRDGLLDEDELAAALEGARILTSNGASNVLGNALDVARLADMARERGVLTLLDAAQTAGEIPVDAGEAGLDMVALTGHKGLLGPQGIGALWVRDRLDVAPFLTGGTGGHSMIRDMPDAMPDRLEAGTLNAPGIAGLEAGVRHVLEQGIDGVRAHHVRLKARLREGLERVPGVRVRSPACPDGVPIVTITADALDPGTLARRLDREHGVLVRAGLHCAPEAHRILGTAETGAVRFSAGWSTTEADVDRAVEAVERIMHGPALPGTAGQRPRAEPKGVPG